MRILHVLPLITARAGGPVAFAAEGAEALADIGVSSRIFATDLGEVPSAGGRRRVSEHELPANSDRLDLQLFPVRPPGRLAYSPAMRRALTEQVEAFDLVHIHSLWLYPQFAAFQAARRAGVPYIVSPHGALDPYLRRHGRGRKFVTDLLWQTRMLERADLLHITTAEEGELIADIAPGVPRSTVPVGVWTDRLRQVGDGERFRATYLNGHRGDVVLFLGRLTYKKGIDVLVQAFGQAGASGALLVVAGPDDEQLKPELERLAHAAGVADRVIFPGPLYRQERADAFAAATVWALSSYTENFGVAVMEALAAGIPTIVSTEVNLAPAMDNAGAGVVAPAEPEAFGVALRELLGDGARRERLRQAGRAFADQYDWSVVGPGLAAMYERALTRRAVS